jgi:hypothetical protein
MVRARVVQIRKIKLFKPWYAVTDSQGFVSQWRGRVGREGASGIVDGETYVFRKDGRKWFVLQAGDRELASAERAGRLGRTWNLNVADRHYGFTRPSMWRSSFELRDDGSALGTVSRKRRNIICDLPDDLPTSVQAFLGFVAMALWNRDAAASSAGSVAVAGG